MFGRRHSVPRVVFAVCVFCLGLLPAVLAKKKPPAHPININTAGASELQQIPGIGPSTAQKILDTRKSYGAFKSVDDLLAIKGIGPKKLDKMRKHLSVGKPPAKSPAKQPGTPSPTASEDEEPEL